MTIAEVSKKYDISADTLRYYERIGLIPPVPRTKSGIRDYDEVSCGWIELMKCMRAAGVQIEALIEYVALFQQGDSTVDARKAILIEQRDQLVERMADMQRSLDRLNYKIERYEQGLMVKGAPAPREAEPRRLTHQRGDPGNGFPRFFVCISQPIWSGSTDFGAFFQQFANWRRICG